MRKKHNPKGRKIGKYLSPIMVAYIAIILVSIIEAIVLAPEMAIPSIILMILFIAITIGTSIYAMIIIYRRNRENANSHQPSGKSRKALNATGWLLLSIAMQSIVILSNIK